MIIFNVLLGVLIRTLMFTSAKSFWGDEWFSINIAQMSYPDAVLYAVLTDIHPPLYPILLNTAVKIFGTSEWVFRSLSFTANSALIYGTYWLAKELLNRKTAFLASLFVAVSPYFLQLSNEVRSYSVLTAVCCYGTIFFLKSLKHPPNSLWPKLYIPIAASTVYIEHYGWFWLFGITVYFLYLLKQDFEGYKKFLIPHGWVLLLCLPSIVLIIHQLFLDRLLDMSRHVQYHSFPLLLKKAGAVYWRLVSGPTFSMLTIDQIIQLMKTSALFWASLVLTAVSMLIVLRSIFEIFKTQKGIFLLFFIITFLPFLLLISVFPIRLDARYLCFSAPFFFILLAYGVGGIKSSWIKTIYLTLLIAISLHADNYMIRLKTDAIHREDYRGMVAYAFEHAGPNDAISGTGAPTDYYGRELGMHTQARYFQGRQALFASNPSAFDKILVLDYIDMNPEINERNFSELSTEMAKINFRSAGDLLRFGGNEGLTVIHIYQKE